MAFDYSSLFVAFLAGAATGAAAQYYGQFFTEKRQRKEAAKEAIADYEESFQHLAEETSSSLGRRDDALQLDKQLSL